MASNLKKLLLIAIVALLSACKAKQAVVAKPVETIVTINDSSQKTIQALLASKPNFRTLYLKADVDYRDSKQSQSVTADIRMERDKTILVSVRFLGFTVAKALVTPDRVQYYEKIGGKYFDGDFASISQWLGTDLDFDRIQNLLLGQTFADLSKQNLAQQQVGTNIELRSKTVGNVQQNYVLSQNPALLLQQIVEQVSQQRKIAVQYSNHETFAQGVLPRNIEIVATKANENTSIRVETTKITFDDELSFSYSVPDGYERLEIKQ